MPSVGVLQAAVRYGAVGVVNTLANAILLYGFITYTGFPSTVCVTLTFVICMAFHFLANRSFTFRASGQISAQLRRYFVIAGLNYTLTLLVIYVLVDLLRMSPIVGVVVATLVTACTGFVLSLVWVFKGE